MSYMHVVGSLTFHGQPITRGPCILVHLISCY